MRGRDPRAVWRQWVVMAPVAGMAALGVAGCQRRPPPLVAEASPHYTVGQPWQGAGGTWFYPREQPDLHQTGLAVVEQAHPQLLTADGERYDPAAVAAAHQTLQLPAVIRVTDLENGRRLLVRVDDRGPASPGRLLALTPAAAQRLGIVAGRPARIAVDLDPGLSRTVASQVGGGPHLDIAAAPVQGVQEQTLDAPGQPRFQARAAAPAAVAAPSAAGPADQPEPTVGSLSTEVAQGVPDPGALWIEAGRFSQRNYADQVAAAAGGTVDISGSGRETLYDVRIGPFGQVAAADAALDRARRAGVTGAHIIVE